MFNRFRQAISDKDSQPECTTEQKHNTKRDTLHEQYKDFMSTVVDKDKPLITLEDVKQGFLKSSNLYRHMYTNSPFEGYELFKYSTVYGGVGVYITVNRVIAWALKNYEQYPLEDGWKILVEKFKYQKVISLMDYERGNLSLLTFPLDLGGGLKVAIDFRGSEVPNDFSKKLQVSWQVIEDSHGIFLSWVKQYFHDQGFSDTDITVMDPHVNLSSVHRGLSAIKVSWTD